MTMEASASTFSSKITKGARKSRRLDAGSRPDPSLASLESRSLSSHPRNPTENLESQCTSKLEERAEILERVVDRHDDLVRELFHMQQFTMMIQYDPAKAKQDNSEVFREFKSNFDLFANAPLPSQSPSRHTRRRLNERRQILRNPSAINLSPLSSPKKKRKSNVVEIEEAWSDMPKRHGKAKEDPKLETAIRQDDVFNGSISLEPRPVSNSQAVSVRRKSVIQLGERASPPLISSSLSCEAEAPVTKKRRLDDSPVSVTVPPADGIRDKAIRFNGVKENGHPAVENGESVSMKVKLRRRVSDKKAADKTKSKLSFIHSPEPSSVTPEVVSEPQSKVKRIKLIVRRPPPQLSNPMQKPPPSKFNTSLPKFLSSYIRVDEGAQNVQLSTLEQRAAKEAKIRAKVAKLRRAGRFIPQREVKDDDSEILDDADYVSPERTSKDYWDAIVEDVIARYQAKSKRNVAQQITISIASKMQAYFDSLEVKRNKAKEVEEKKLRNLAKSTMRMVIGEWRKAVFHIREKQRLVEEEEERRLGRAHLDAILSQSGQILETQQEDLSRGDLYRSRSQSESYAEFDLDSEFDLEERSDDGQKEDEDGKTASDSGDEMEVGFPDYFDDKATETPIRSRSPTSISDVDDGLTLHLLGGDPSMDAEFDAPSEIHLDELDHANPESSPICHAENLASTIGVSDGIPPSKEDPVLTDVEVATDAQASPPTVSRSPEPNESLRSEQVTSADANDDMVEVLDSATSVQSGAIEDTVEERISEENVPDEEEPNEEEVQEGQEEVRIPEHLKPYAVAPVNWNSDKKLTPPLLLRGVLRPYQQSGLEWLASLHTNKLNGILADEMGLGKTIQTIALLAHLACDIGIWGPHLIIVPTSVLLNWEMEFKKFFPGCRVLSYHGSTKRRKELRQGWNDKHHFNVCITSYALASRDAHIFKRKAWYYMILDEAHMIKNFKSQRWNILLMFRSYRRLLLTGTPLQNNLTELWALLQFLMSGANFANLKEFGEWFSNPLEKAIEMGNIHDDETLQRASKLHTVLRPYLLRRLKRDVEKELPSKFEHLMLCPLSKRQRYLYDEFMSRAHTKDALESGVYQKIANILMQLRKVCNHPDLFEVRPIVTSFTMTRSAIANYEIKEFLVRRQLFSENNEGLSLDTLNLRFIDHQNVPLLQALETKRLDASNQFLATGGGTDELPANNTRIIEDFLRFSTAFKRAENVARLSHIGYLNRLRCNRMPVYSEECLSTVNKMTTRLLPFSHLDTLCNYMDNVDRINQTVVSYSGRAQAMAQTLNLFAFITPPVVALDLPSLALAGCTAVMRQQPVNFDQPLHTSAVKLQIAFPETALLQYDCGKLQKLATLLREKKTGGHRVLIFTQMTRILDILEVFLNFHGYLYLRLDGSTKIEDRQYITERFNADPRMFCFISSSRSGGVGINLTGADTVVFFDSDFNPQMDKQCEDRAHRIGQIRDVHIYRFVSQFTVEEAMLRKANQKRSLDELVIQKGEFDWRTLFNDDSTSALTKALGEYEDTEDRLAAIAAAREETNLDGADDEDFEEGDGGAGGTAAEPAMAPDDIEIEEEQGATVVDYMIAFIELDWDNFSDWRV